MIEPMKRNVPDGWEAKLLGNVLDKIVGGGTPSKSVRKYWDGSIPWLTVKDMRTQRPVDAIDHISEDAVRESSTNIIPEDTVIIATRIGLGKVIRVPYKAAINQDLKALIAPPNVSKGYLEYWLLSIANYLESIGSGTTVKGIRLEQVRSLSFPLAPLDEQNRIVEEIEKQFSRLDEAVANLKRVKANLKRYKASVLQAAVTGKLTEEWRKQNPDVEPARKLLKRILTERRQKWEETELAKLRAKGKDPKNDKWKEKYKEPVAPDISSLPNLPVGWVYVSTETTSFVTKLAGFEYTKFVNYNPDGDISVIKAENAGKNGFKHTDFSKVLKNKVSLLTRSKIVANDVLMVFVGAGTGNVARVPDDQEYFLGPNIAMIRVEVNNIEPAYLEYYFRSPLGNALALSYSKAVAQPSLSMGSIRLIPLMLPCLNEQKIIIQEIESRLSVAEKIERSVDTNLKRAERLRQSILKQAFSGKLV